MKKLSVCMIIKNEERVLTRCLNCAVQFADELIIVDTGSTDNSVEIARKYTPFVYIHPWQNSFAKARNYSYSKATGDYIMWLDADDVISDENIGKINSLKEETVDTDMIYMIYKDYTQSGITSYILRDRIVRKAIFKEWHYDVHETILLKECLKMLYRPDIEILHKKEYVNEPKRNMNIYNGLLKSGKPLSLHEKVNFVRELSQQGKAEEALTLFRDIRSYLPTGSYAYAFTYLMAELRWAKRWSECLALIEEAQKHITLTPRMLYTEGVCMDGLGKIDEAEKLYYAAIAAKDDPMTFSTCYTGYNDYFPYLRLAKLEKKRGNQKKATCFLNRAKSTYPNDINWRITQLGITLNIEYTYNKKEKKTMAKTEQELNELKKEIEQLNAKLQTLSAEELEKVTGGHDSSDWCRECDGDPSNCTNLKGKGGIYCRYGR